MTCDCRKQMGLVIAKPTVYICCGNEEDLVSKAIVHIGETFNLNLKTKLEKRACKPLSNNLIMIIRLKKDIL